MKLSFASLRRTLIAATAMLATTTGGMAQFSYGDFSSVEGLTLNGTATQSGSSIRLTENSSSNQAASVFFNTPQDISHAFTATINFSITSNFDHLELTNGGFGVGLVIHRADSGAESLGMADKYRGIKGIDAPWVAVVAATSNLTPDGQSVHQNTQLWLNTPYGEYDITDAPAFGFLTPAIQHTLTLEYDGFNLFTVSLDGVQQLEYTLDDTLAAYLGGTTAWIGATASTNSSLIGYAEHNLHSMTYTAVPKPSTYAGIAGLAVLGIVLLARRGQR